MTWADDAVTFRSIWADDLRLYINGVDVTRLRGVETEVSQYQLMEPFEYGPGSFRFPQVSDLEIRSNPAALAADLTWMRHEARASLVPIVDGVPGKAVWRGFVTTIHPTGGVVEIGCAGDAAGRFALDVRPARMFRSKHDLGYFVFQAFREQNLPLTPVQGPDTGIVVDARGGWEDKLTYVSGLLADAQTVGGTVWTVRRNEADTAYEMVPKDLTTVHATIFAGTHGVQLDVTDDLSEKPNTYYGSGIAADGHKWMNAVMPGIVTEDAVPYPMAGGASFGLGTTDADTIDGSGITRMITKLVHANLLDLEDSPGQYDADGVEAVKDLQRRSGLNVTGTMNENTWDALYDVAATGYSVAGAAVLPLAQDLRVREWNRTALGNLAGRNPYWDPDSVVVARHISHGLLAKNRATRWSVGEIERLDGPNYVGTITLDGADVFQGNYEHGDPSPVLLSRLEVRSGWNLMVRGFDGDTLFHVSGGNINGDGTVTFAVDTQARDLMTVAEIIARNRESRRNRGREFRQAHRSSGAVHDAIVGWFEQGGKLGQDIPVEAGKWKVFPVVGGQEGTVAKLRLRVKTTGGDGVAFYAAVFGEKVTAKWLTAHVPDPTAKDADGNYAWLTTSQEDRLFNQRVLLAAYGTEEEPGGYWPYHHTNPDTGEATSRQPTGVLLDDSGFAYRCYGQPLLWVAVYALADAEVKAGRIMWQQIEEGF